MPDDHGANLLDLIRLGHGAARLQIQNLRDLRLRKDLATPFRMLTETEGLEERTQVIETDVGVSRAAPDRLTRLRHAQRNKSRWVGGSGRGVEGSEPVRCLVEEIEDELMEKILRKCEGPAAVCCLPFAGRSGESAPRSPLAWR